MWFITKRQGMGFGDIQLGIVLGAMLGPMRMALTLFFASLLSLLSWIVVSIFKGFNRDRAMPMAPFLIWTTAGSLIWTLLLTIAGMVLGEGYSNVEVWIDPVSKVIKVGLVIAVLAGGIWLALRIWRRRQSAD